MGTPIRHPDGVAVLLVVWGWVMGVGAFAYSAKNKGNKATVLQSTGACITRVRFANMNFSRLSERYEDICHQIAVRLIGRC